MVSMRASPACANCRSRRIKCNLLKPRCSQCARAGLVCNGYRSQSELLFRDQTKTTMNKVHNMGIQVMVMNNYVIHWDPLVKPTFEMEDVAQKVFADNFPVLGEGCKMWMERGAEKLSSATISLTSVGLAALAVVHRDPQIMTLARKKYDTAIKILTTAIVHHGKTGVEQSTAASFILSIFEMITCDSPSASNAWQKHVLGAAAFLGYLCAGNGLPVSPVSEIVDICFTTALACLANDRLVSTFLLELPRRFEKSSNMLNGETPPLMLAMRLFAIMGKLVNIRVLANQNMLLPSQIVAFTTQSNQALQDWASSLPSTWKFVSSMERPYPIYQNVWFARIWNYFRLASILANRIILDNTELLLSSDSPIHILSIESSRIDYSQSHFTMARLLQDIYDSVPFMVDSEHMSSTSLPLSATLFFITTVLQSLLKITDRTALFANWSTPAIAALGERFALTKGLVMQNLIHEE